MNISKTHNYRSGFSLIEVLVSLSIFTIVVTISVSTLYTLIEANSRSRNSQSIATNLSFTLDSITREIRTGRDYFCTGNINSLPYGKGDETTSDCSGGAAYFSFNEGGRSLTGNTPNDSRRIAFRLENGKLQRRLGSGDNNDSNVNQDADWLNLTSDDVTITDLRFYVTGAVRGEGDDQAPMVTLFLSGTVGEEALNQSDFSIQTTIAQRLLDV